MPLYIATFLIALATLALEITFSRLLSLTTQYHLAFFALSTAMLGMTAGAVRVYLRPERFNHERWAHEAASASLAFAIAAPCSVVMLCLIPTGIMLMTMSVLSLLATTVVCSIPFYFVGIAITLALTRSNLPIGRIYGADLTGAALGCLFVLGGLEVRGAPSIALWCAAAGAWAAVFYGARRSFGFRTLAVLVAIGLSTAGGLNQFGRWGVFPVVRKGLFEMPSGISQATDQLGAARIYQIVETEKWNALSRVSISPERLAADIPLWAPGAGRTAYPIPIRELHIDGGASTTLRRFQSPEDIAAQKFDLVNLAYELRPNASAAVIGLGGGKDAQSAIAFGHTRITAIDVNPAVVEVVTGELRDFVGLADHPGVTIVNDDARSYLTHTDEKFAVVQMSLIDSWASTQAGAFTLSENALYTVEGWQVFLERLEDDGVFTVTRMFDPNNIAETGRMVSLGVASLLAHGVEDPSQHIALCKFGIIGTMVVSNQPFTEQDLTTIDGFCERLGFEVIAHPGRPCELPELAELITSKNRDELEAVAAKSKLNYSPPTDEDPYFFNLLRFEHLAEGWAKSDGGIIFGNITATFVLLGLVGSLAVLAFLTIVVPLTLRRRQPDERRIPIWAMFTGGLYFSAIGAGFMFGELALIQRLSVFLGHPTYALGILLFTIILAAGLGSLVSERLPVTKRVWLVLLAAIAAGAMLALDLGVKFVLQEMITSELPARIAVAVVLIAPTGFLLGMFFPAGMRLAQRADAADTPWFWALNGVFGVLASAVAVLVSLYLGISKNFEIAAACYASLIVSGFGLSLARPRPQVVDAEPIADATPIVEPEPEPAPQPAPEPQPEPLDDDAPPTFDLDPDPDPKPGPA